MKSQNQHAWKFFRAGGFDQVRLGSDADLANLDQLDQKLWVALACPTTGLEFDPKTLALIDTDHDGRIRAPELIAAARWLTGLLRNPSDSLKGAHSLPLSAINDANSEGAQLLASARQILLNLGKGATGEITVEDTTDTARVFAQTMFNGDGIIPAEAAAEESTRSVIQDVITCFGAETDRSGKPGVNQAKVDQLFAQAQAYSDWWQECEGKPEILPLGEATGSASNAVKAVRPKLDDYFARCRLAAFDPRALNALNRDEKEYFAVAAKDLTISSVDVAGFPLAQIEPGKPLPLDKTINPAWARAIEDLQTLAIVPLLGDKSSLTEEDWNELQARLRPFETWTAAKAGAVVEKLGIKRVREILASKAREEITKLIAKDQALEPEANAISSVDRLVRYHRDLFLLCKNFVNFADFYERGDAAIFLAGTLYLDQRSCQFTLPVADPARHAALAGLAGAYLAYCDCTRKSTGEKRQIVAAFTDGDSDNLMAGRNGVFYDRKGQDWDATITKIIDNPISLRQAFWAPYKKFVRFIEEQVAKRAAAAETASTAKLQESATELTSPDKSKPGQPKKVDVGTVAAMGVAFGAIGAFITALWAQILGIIKIGPLAIIGAFIALMALISGPSLVLAYIKLRKRNLGPILDANGWAVNAKAKINVPFGKSLTQVAKLPRGAELNRVDPFREKRRAGLWLAIVLIILVILGWYWYEGSLDRVLPKNMKSISVLGTNAPGYQRFSGSPTNTSVPANPFAVPKP